MLIDTSAVTAPPIAIVRLAKLRIAISGLGLARLCRIHQIISASPSARAPSDQLFVHPAHQGRGIGKMLLQFTRKMSPDEIWLRCVKQNRKAWSWYEREGFRLEKEEPHPDHGLMMRHYRWKKGTDG